MTILKGSNSKTREQRVKMMVRKKMRVQVSPYLKLSRYITVEKFFRNHVFSRISFPVFYFSRFSVRCFSFRSSDIKSFKKRAIILFKSKGGCLMRTELFDEPSCRTCNSLIDCKERRTKKRVFLSVCVVCVSVRFLADVKATSETDFA